MHSIYFYAFVIILLALSWGLSNRGRGWGPINPKPPKWQAWLSEFCDRNTMAAWHGISIILAAIAFDVPLWWQPMALALSTAALWRFGTSPGWGEYQDGKITGNNEIAWIDRLVKWLLPSRKFETDPALIDGVSMAIRGIYYLPIFIAAGLIMESAWFALPAAFFWVPGAVYGYFWHRVPDRRKVAYVVLYAEWVDDTIRGLFFFIAFAGSLRLVG